MKTMSIEKKELLDLIKTLSECRKEQVLFQVKIDKLMDKKKLHELAMKRLEAGHINAVENAKDQNNQPLLTNEWSKKAAVEERLVQDGRFTKLLQLHRSVCKAITKNMGKVNTLEISITEMESREKILLIV